MAKEEADEGGDRKGVIQQRKHPLPLPVPTQERAHELSEEDFNCKSPKSLFQFASHLWDKHHDENISERRGCVGLQSPDYSPSSMEVSAGTEAETME